MEHRRFAVIGLGSFGHHLAAALHGMGHDVLALDRDPVAVDAVAPHCSTAKLVDATDREQLAVAGVSEADVAVVALGSRMDVSILATLFLRELGVREIIAKAVSHDHGRILSRIGATEVIYPERDVALQLAQHLAQPDVLEKVPFLEGFALMEFRAPCALWGKTLADSNLRRAHKISVVLLRRPRGTEENTIPAQAQERVLEGDTLVVLARPEDVDAFRKAHPG